MLVDASVGFSGVGTINADGEEIPTTGLPQVDIVAAHAALYIGTQRGSLSLGFDSTLDTNLLAELVYESRGCVSGTYTIAKHVAAGVSIAATHTLHRDATLTEDRVPRDGVRALLTLTATHALYKSE
ncbi:MAG TPA: hypothetical protein VNO30_22540, partial [Kofleriaceae bacterium]|nr:hypothetical protein [Kofleriaceae bacterium]